MEYDSPARTSAPHRYRTLAPDPEPTSRKTRHSHTNRPPDDSQSTYTPPSVPVSSSSLPTPTQEAQQKLSWKQSTPPSISHPSSSPPPPSSNINNSNNSFSSSNNNLNNSNNTNPDSPPSPRQYTQYSESVYLSRLPDQPTDSMLLDSMMKSSFLSHHQPPSSPSFAHSSSPSSSFIDSSQQTLPSFSSDPAAFDASSSLVDSRPDMGQQSPNLGQQSPDMEASDVSLASTTSSIYYDAAGSASYLMGSVNEGAFENPSEPR